MYGFTDAAKTALYIYICVFFISCKSWESPGLYAVMIENSADTAFEASRQIGVSSKADHFCTICCSLASFVNTEQYCVVLMSALSAHLLKRTCAGKSERANNNKNNNNKGLLGYITTMLKQ